MITYDRIFMCPDGEQDRRFKEETRRVFSSEMHSGMDLCHSISYATIQDAVILALNNLTSSVQNADIRMNGIINAVTFISCDHERYGDEDFTNNSDRVRITCKRKYKDIKHMTETDQICQEANEILDQLNNCFVNLRPGDSSWNRKVNYSYDPRMWVYVNRDEEKICDAKQSILRYRDMSPEEIVKYEITGFYLTDVDDGFKLSILTSSGLEGLVSLDRYVRGEDLMYIASSNNQFPNEYQFTITGTRYKEYNGDVCTYDQTYYLGPNGQWQPLFPDPER